MSKRQKRYLNSIILENKSELLGQMVNLLLADNKVYAGIISQINTEQLVINDTHTHQLKFQLSEIIEVIKDYESPY
ncbi:MAG: hypothetical protein EAZ07_04900 [Cytophagales bacterium]|nr:MAG: hypothetical protein EAZ07_04900 [Cytophagales bacterium]